MARRASEGGGHIKIARIAGIGLIAACMLLLASCAQAQEADVTVAEGVDTPITVSYEAQPELPDGYFLAEGDSVAVISLSALPSPPSHTWWAPAACLRPSHWIQLA